jgi:hypothetical protein
MYNSGMIEKLQFIPNTPDDTHRLNVSYMNRFDRSPFIHIHMQPDFPASDLSEQNAEVLPYILDDASGVEAHAQVLQDHQRAAYDMAYRVLRMGDRLTRYTQRDYQAYTRGFAAFEAIASIVRPVTEYDTSYAANKLAKLILSPARMLASAQSWPSIRPNTHDAVTTIGLRRGETLSELRARSLGAHLAFELQRPLLDAA